MKIIICRGIPASGKSTWAKQWVQQSPKNRIRINYDDMRMMFGEYWVPHRENFPFLKDIRNSILRNAIYNDFDIVIDMTKQTAISAMVTEVSPSQWGKMWPEYETAERCLDKTSAGGGGNPPYGL